MTEPTVDVEEGTPPYWPMLAVDGPLFATPGWLRAMERRLGDRPVTIVVRRDGQPTLAAYASVQTEHKPGELFDLHHTIVEPAPELPLTPHAREQRTRLVADGPPAESWLPCLVLMLPGYQCVPVGPDANDRVAAGALVRGAVEWAADNDIPTVAALYTRPEATALTAALREHGFAEVPLTPTWDLRLPGTGLADYISWLPHKRRIEARRELRMLGEAGVRIGPADVHDVFDDLVRLRYQLVTKYRGRRRDLEGERAKLRKLVDEVAGGQPRVVLARAGDLPVGFALFAEHRGVWHCLSVGSDYSDPRSRLTYFGTAYYRAAEYAYESGIRTIGYGLGAWQAKRARGCRPTALTGWVRSTVDELAATAAASSRITELITY